MHALESLPRKRKAADISNSPPSPDDSSTVTTSDDVEERSEDNESATSTPTPVARPSPPAPSSSRLLSLPAELRLEIYRHVLQNPEPLKLTPTTPLPPEPALLQTSRQLRAEASPVYYNINRFKIYITDFDAAWYQQWYNSSLARRRSRKEYVIRESHNWKNLLTWLRAYYLGESSMPGPRRSGKPCISAAMFSLVRRMKRKQGLGWEEIERNLGDVHDGLVATDSRWAV